MEIISLLTHPLKFSFSSKKLSETKHSFEVIDHNSGNPVKMDYLKLPSGVIEAKTLSLILSHKHLHTICLTHPDRGYHPQMIEKLRNLVLRKFNDKTILISTFHPSMMSTWSMERTHVFRRKQTAREIVFHVVPINTSVIHRFTGDEFKKLLYASQVLFVEGPTDKLILNAVFNHIKHCDEPSMKYLNAAEMESIKQFLFGIQIVELGGKTLHNVTKDLKEQLQFQDMYVYDHDAFYETKKPKMETLSEKLTEWLKSKKTGDFKYVRSLNKALKEVLQNRWFLLRNLIEKPPGLPYDKIILTFQSTLSDMTKCSASENEGILQELKVCSPFLSTQNVEQNIRSFLSGFIYTERAELKATKHLQDNYGLELDADPIDHERFAIKTQSQNIFFWKDGNLEEMICKTYFPDDKSGELSKDDQLLWMLPEASADTHKTMKNMIVQLGYSELSTVASFILKGDAMQLFVKFVIKMLKSYKY